ncbi:MAG TPA: NADH-quinone oxidoreductase subunit J [Gemmatimonadaceae bacterium]|nr:NADH-quinone oxidoreductase subunit J [Gemmatimonadaceae bacterium]
MRYPLFYTFHFYLFGLIAIASALTFVTRKSPVAAALWLVNTMFALAALYIMLDAHFIGAIQVIVYAGAIMVVFLFVIMLLNLGHPGEIADARGLWGKLAAGAVGLVLLVQLLVTVRGRLPAHLVSLPAVPAEPLAAPDVLGPIGDALMGEHVIAFEIAAVLLLAAIVGAVILGKRRA